MTPNCPGAIPCIFFSEVILTILLSMRCIVPGVNSGVCRFLNVIGVLCERSPRGFPDMNWNPLKSRMFPYCVSGSDPFETYSIFCSGSFFMTNHGPPLRPRPFLCPMVWNQYPLCLPTICPLFKSIISPSFSPK